MDEIKNVIGNALLFSIGIALGLIGAGLLYMLIPHIRCWLGL